MDAPSRGAAAGGFSDSTGDKGWPYPRQHHLGEVTAFDVQNDVGINDSHPDFFGGRAGYIGDVAAGAGADVGSADGHRQHQHHPFRQHRQDEYDVGAGFDDGNHRAMNDGDDLDGAAVSDVNENGDLLLTWYSIPSSSSSSSSSAEGSFDDGGAVLVDEGEIDPANISMFVSGTVVRAEEVGIVLVVVALWVAAVVLFFNRWGKIRMLEPYVPPSYLLATAVKEDPPSLTHRVSCPNTSVTQLPRVSRPSISIDVHHMAYRNSIVDRYNPILHMPSRCRSRTNSVFVYSPVSQADPDSPPNGESTPNTRRSRSAENLATPAASHPAVATRDKSRGSMSAGLNRSFLANGVSRSPQLRHLRTPRRASVSAPMSYSGLQHCCGPASQMSPFIRRSHHHINYQGDPRHQQRRTSYCFTGNLRDQRRQLGGSRVLEGVDETMYTPTYPASTVSDTYCGYGRRMSNASVTSGGGAFFSASSAAPPADRRRRRSRSGSVDWAAVTAAARADNDRLRANSFSTSNSRNSLLLGNSASTGAMMSLLGSPLVLRRSSDSARSSIIIQQTIPEIKTDDGGDGDGDGYGGPPADSDRTNAAAATAASSNTAPGGLGSKRNSLVVVDFCVGPPSSTPSEASAENRSGSRLSNFADSRSQQASLDSAGGAGERRFSATSMGKAMALRIPSADESTTSDDSTTAAAAAAAVFNNQPTRQRQTFSGDGRKPAECEEDERVRKQRARAAMITITTTSV